MISYSRFGCLCLLALSCCAVLLPFRTDYYTRAPVRIHVIWRGNSAISGGALCHDDVLMAYSRDLATVKGWLKR